MEGLFAGIDLGTTFTAAAVARGTDSPEMVSLGPAGAAIPSVLYLRDDGSVATGSAAVQRAVAEPGRVAREFKRRLGDPAPVFMAGTPMAAHLLMSRLLEWVTDRITEREGEELTHIVVTHPANWGGYKRDYLRQAVDRAGVRSWSTLTEPEAAAIHYAARERVDAGETVAVYDLGGGTFDAAVLRRTDDGFEIIGRPHGIENLGGIDFDQAVFKHLVGQVSDHLETVDSNDPAVVSALARLQTDAEAAKISLSSETDTAIPVSLPGLHTTVRLTRQEFEDMIRPTVGETIDSLRHAIDDAGIEPDDLTKVLLVGGSSRIPLIAQMVTDALGRPVAVDADPKHAIALGAALHARAQHTQSVAATPAPAAGEPINDQTDETIEPEPPTGDRTEGKAADHDDEPAGSHGTAPAHGIPDDPRPPPGAEKSDVEWWRRPWIAAAVVALALVVAVAVITRGGGPDDSATAATAAVGDEVTTTDGIVTSTVTSLPDLSTVTSLPDLSTVTSLPDLSGTEIRLAGVSFTPEMLDVFESVFVDRFGDPTGADIATELWTSDDLGALLAAGDVPDLALGLDNTIATTLDSGAAIALEDMGFTTAQLEGAFGAEMLRPGEFEGKHYAIPLAYQPFSVIYYNQRIFEESGYEPPATLTDLESLSETMVAEGWTPWCIGLESGASTGWPAALWVDDLVLRIAGPDIHDQWADHEIPFDHPAVLAAAEAFESIWSEPGYVLDGPAGMLNTNFADAADPMFDDPPGCLMHRQHSFMVNLFPEGALGSEIGIIPFPGIGQGGSIVDGWYVVAMDDRPEIRALIETLLEPDIHCGIVDGFDAVAPHLDTDVSCHTGPVAGPVAASVQADLRAGSARTSAVNRMPPEVGAGAVWTAMVDWVGGVQSLESAFADVDLNWPE